MPTSSGSELTVLLRHVPKIVVSRFLNQPERPRGPESCSFLATVALFDISGFSSLGSRLSEDERRQSRDPHNSNSSNNNSGSAASPSTSPSSPSAVTLGPAVNQQPLTSAARSSSVIKVQKVSKSRIPTAANIFSSGYRELSRREHSSRRELSSKRESSAKNDDEASLEGDGDESSPSDKMRQRRQSSAQFSSPSSMSFVHGPKTSTATQGIAVETLTTALNQSLKPVIDVILKHGGDIIKFAGDALIVMWETEASRGKVTPAGELVYRAACCALEALHALEAAVGEHDSEPSHLKLLGMHVGIGVSEMTGNHVGGVLNRWEFYLSGDANRQMSFAEENAKKGQLALSPEAFNALETRFGTLPELDIVCHRIEQVLHSHRLNRPPI
ncbi:hypothetical protein ON010_g16658 [Phytophthora cinnamomi]|nr:hypothetical protein ON010_g16658 [Phytophthora cinnamomi]